MRRQVQVCVRSIELTHNGKRMNIREEEDSSNPIYALLTVRRSLALYRECKRRCCVLFNQRLSQFRHFLSNGASVDFAVLVFFRRFRLNALFATCLLVSRGRHTRHRDIARESRNQSEELQISAVHIARGVA